MVNINQDSPEGKALQRLVQRKLADYLGEGYNDEVLPLYIVVMLAHNSSEPVVAENLEAFLGDNSAAFTAWLFQHMGESSKVEALQAITNAGGVPSPMQAATPVAASPADAAAQNDDKPPSAEVGQLSLTASMSDGESEASDAEEGQHESRRSSPSRSRSERRSDRRRHHSDGQASGRGSEHARMRSDRDAEARLRHRSSREGRHDRRKDVPDRYDPSGSHRHEHYDRWRHDGGRTRVEEWRRREWLAYCDGYDTWGGSWEAAPPPGGWHRTHPQPTGSYDWPPGPPPFRDSRYYDRGSYGTERQRYRSLSPPHHNNRGGRSNHDAGWGGPLPEPYHGREAEGTGREFRVKRREQRRGSSGVPPEVDFEAKAQDVQAEYRRPPIMLQLAHPQQHQLQKYQQEAAPEAAASAKNGMDIAASTPAGQQIGGGALQPASAFVRLSGLRPPQQPLGSQSLPAGLSGGEQHDFVFESLDADNGTEAQPMQQDPVQEQQQQQQQQKQPGSVFARLAGRRQSARNAGGSVWQRLAAPAPGESMIGAGNDTVAEIKQQLREVTTLLDQLRAGAAEERASHWAAANQATQVLQGPADARSITVTSVHPLALEHAAILRAHFGVCGRIVRATVLRDRTTGVPSGKAHIEYDNVLAARKALRLSHSLLLDRPVRVRAKGMHF